MDESGTPFSSASCLTDGEMADWRSREVSMRLPLESDSMAKGAESSFAWGAVFDPEFGGSLASETSPSLDGLSDFLSPPASSIVKDSKGEASPPSSIKIAMGCEKLASDSIQV